MKNTVVVVNANEKGAAKIYFNNIRFAEGIVLADITAVNEKEQKIEISGEDNKPVKAISVEMKRHVIATGLQACGLESDEYLSEATGAEAELNETLKTVLDDNAELNKKITGADKTIAGLNEKITAADKTIAGLNEQIKSLDETKPDGKKK